MKILDKVFGALLVIIIGLGVSLMVHDVWALAASPDFTVDTNTGVIIWRCGQLDQAYKDSERLHVQQGPYDPLCLSLGKALGVIKDDGAGTEK